MAFKKNVCKVIRVFHEDIINYKSFVAFLQYLSVHKDTAVEECEKKGGKGEKAEKGKKVYWSKLMIISFTKNDQMKCFLNTNTVKRSITILNSVAL